MADTMSGSVALELDSANNSLNASPDHNVSSGSPKAAVLSPKTQQELSGQAAKGKKTKSQDLSADFVNVLSSRIEEIERAVAAGHGGPAEREAAKARKKQLRDVAKFCSDRSHSAEDRIAFIQSKYAQQLSELLRLERQLLELQGQHEGLTKEKDKVQSELKKTNLLKDKLEELCRQLQKEAREVAEESRRRNEEDLRQRQALQAKFTAAINEVSEKMEAQATERSRQLAENEEMRAKLDTFLGQFESFNSLVQKKDLELQLANSRAEQATQQAAQLKQRSDLLQDANGKYAAAIESLKPQLSELESLRQRNALLAAAKDELQTQLEHYAEKFAEFQDTLTKSNETFANLREQMETGAKARSVLIRERDEARRRAEANDTTVVALLQDRLQLKEQTETLTARLRAESEELRRTRTQKERLEGLCRALQGELRASKAAAGGTAGPVGTGTATGGSAGGLGGGEEGPDASNGAEGEAPVGQAAAASGVALSQGQEGAGAKEEEEGGGGVRSAATGEEVAAGGPSEARAAVDEDGKKEEGAERQGGGDEVQQAAVSPTRLTAKVDVTEASGVDTAVATVVDDVGLGAAGGAGEDESGAQQHSEIDALVHGLPQDLY